MSTTQKMNEETASDVMAAETVFRKVRRPGGMPLPDLALKQMLTWWRTLARRGYTDETFLCDRENVLRTFREKYPVGKTRYAYARVIMTYISGLDDEAFKMAFPNLKREDLVLTLRAVITDALRKTDG
jgi:hypothetical protein